MLDVTNRIVSIDLAIGEVGAGMLCFSHAEKIVVPRGWTLVDNRSVRPPLFDGERYEVPSLPEVLPAVEVATPLAATKRRDKQRRSPLPGADSRFSDTGDPEARPSNPPGPRSAWQSDEDQFDLRHADVTSPAAASRIEVVVDVTSAYADAERTDRLLRVEHVGALDGSIDVRESEPESESAHEAGNYDLPAAYRDGVAHVALDEPDREASPLLARAFDVTRTKRRP